MHFYLTHSVNDKLAKAQQQRNLPTFRCKDGHLIFHSHPRRQWMS